ncbi:MAG: hypothetical protein LBJ13_01400 [Puniceicoccales bacterium]|jgi:Tfp pilus assembly protein PilN|nr:hypothetical protein [Puniceicoccales bacterium]
MGKLTESFSNWKEEREIAQSERVCIVPSEVCFMNNCPLPEGKLNNETIENVALLSLESSSPFPPNDMFWGYMIDKSAAIIRIFSALKVRVKATDTTADSAAYVLPSFLIPVLNYSIHKAILKHNDSTKLYEKTANGEMIITNEIPPDPNIPIFDLESIQAVPEFGITIHYAYQENASANSIHKVISLPFQDSRLMAANMQNADLKKFNKQNKTTTNISLTVTAVMTLVIISALVGFFIFGHMFRKEKQFGKTLSKKDEQVKQIQQKDERAHELDLFSNRQHAYFRGLDQINALRPDSITFKSLYASEGENFEIKCAAKSLEDVEKFKKVLEESLLFKVVRVEDKSIQDNQIINFSLFLTFRKL